MDSKEEDTAPPCTNSSHQNGKYRYFNEMNNQYPRQ